MPQEENPMRNGLTLDEKDYRELLTYLPEGVVITDLDETLIFVNDEFASMLGYMSKELVGMNVKSLISEREIVLLEKESAKRAIGVSSAYNLRMIRKDGGEIIVKISGVPRRNEEDNVIGTMAVVIDITAEREKELELLKLSSAIAASPTSVVITDLEGTIEYVNPRFSELTGYTAKEAIGNNPRVLKSGRTPPEVYNELWETIKSGKVWRGRFINRMKNGELYWEDAWISPIKNHEGSITHFVAVKEDITRNVVAEEKLKLSNKELELYASFLQHDLRNDLHVLMNHAEAALMMIETESRVFEYIQIVQAASERMVNLLDIFGHPAETDETTIIDILERAKTQAEKTHSNLTVNIEIDTENSEIKSARLIPMVFDNLLRNAARFAEKNVTVTITVSRNENGISIIVSDDGPGIPNEIQLRLFEKGASTTGGGHGLYLTKKVIESYGGKINYVQNMNQTGTCFHILLPAK
ncbi:PAS domain S-box protein [Candidatus Thorarchaeota archaeon]|nr:MAG: PAS domain S-box protein [Candidatus Thorarchaeota archaeon]